MKSSLFSLTSLVLVSLPLAIGCGTIDEGTGPQYPQPVGYDSPEQDVAASGAAPPIAPLAGAPGQSGADEDELAPRSGDIQVGTDDASYADTDPSALTDFKPALDPYGTWSDDPTYGTVWSPSPTVVGADFAPYVTAGHWAYDDDYVWVSDYDWGWAPFHYGRWVYTGRGWGWIPGRTYAGAWVTWRYGIDDFGYVGWAPLPPTWYWRGGYALGIGFVPRAPYVFCGRGDVFSPGVGSRIVTGSQVGVVAGRTRPYVPATPGVGGHVAAHPQVSGPPPSTLKIAESSVVHASPTERQLLHAQQFARPQTAQLLGAQPPAHVVEARALAAAPAYRRTPFNPNAAVATSPQYRGVAPTPHPQAYGPAQSYGTSYAAPRPTAPAYSQPYASPRPSYGQTYAAPRPSYGQTYAAPRPSAPSYSAPVQSRPSAPSYSAPVQSRPSAPSYSAPVQSRPSVQQYSAPVQSHPSVSAPRFSAPVSRPSSGGHSGHR